MWYIVKTAIRWVDGVELWSTKRKSKQTKEAQVQQFLREILIITFWNRSSEILENPSCDATLEPRSHLHSQPKGDKRNLPHGSFLKMIIIYAIVSRHVLLKHLRRHSFLNLGWSQNIRAYRLNITEMPSDLRQRSSIFPTFEKPHRPRVPPMMRTLSINRKKHHLPKPKVISFFLPLQQYMTKHHVALHAKEVRRVTS